MQKVGTLGKVKALATNIGKGISGLFRSGVQKAKNLKKDWWDDLGDEKEVKQIVGKGGNPVNTKKI
jgi:hypothetical protein